MKKEKKRYHCTISVPLITYNQLVEIKNILSEKFGVDIKLNSVLIKIVSEKLRELKEEKRE
jgi:hypothetical protein